MLADMSTEIDAARLLMYRAAAMRARHPARRGADDGSRRWRSCSHRKPRTARRTTRVQVFGGHGYLTEFPVERYFRDARAMTLYEETSEIERLVIERELAR